MSVDQLPKTETFKCSKCGGTQCKYLEILESPVESFNVDPESVIATLKDVPSHQLTVEEFLNTNKLIFVGYQCSSCHTVFSEEEIEENLI